MRKIIRAISVVALGVCGLAMGCGGGSGGDGGTGGAGGSGGGTGGGTGGSGGGTGGSGGSTMSSCDAKCMDGSECPSVACACNDGTTINTQSCNSGCCETKEAACPNTCAQNGGWGSGGAGGSGGSGGTGGSSGAEFGADCTSNADCQSGICFHVNTNDDTVQKCTKMCEFGTGECGSGWDCSEITDASGSSQKLCLLN